MKQGFPLWDQSILSIKIDLMIKYINLCLFSFVLLASRAFADASQYALLDEIKIEDISSKGLAVVIDRGHLEDYRNGDYAKIYVQKGSLDRPVIFLVAEAELVKVLPKNSYWAIRKRVMPNELTKNKRLLLLSDTKVANGRRNIISNKQVVFSDHDYKTSEEFLEKNKNSVPDRLVKNANDYDTVEQIEENLTNPELAANKTVIAKTYEYYKESPTVVAQTQYGQSVPKKYFIGNREVRLGDLSKQEDRILLESMSKNYQDKVANLNYGVESFYRNAQAVEVSSTATVDSIYKEYKDAERAEKVISPRAIAKIKKDGPMWSASMNDEQLRRYLVESGLESEVNRRKKALNELDGNEIIFHFTNGLMSNSNIEDVNYRSPGHSVGISYDYHFSRIHEKYKKITFQLMFEKGISNFDAGSINLKGDDTIYGGYINYYLHNSPLTLYDFSWLVGIGLKNGQTLASSGLIEDNYKYQLLAPSLQTMLKYRLRAGKYNEDTANVGLSINLGAMMDFKTLKVINELNDDINGNISYLDLKYIVGLSVFF